MTKLPPITRFTPGRYLVISFDPYYPHGGMWDFEEAFPSVEAALAFCNGSEEMRGWDSVHLVDTVEGVFYDLEKSPFKDVGFAKPSIGEWKEVPWELPVEEEPS